MLQFAKGDKKKINRCHLHEDEVRASTSTSERHTKIARKDSTPSPDPLMFAIFRSFQSKLKKKNKQICIYICRYTSEDIIEKKVLQRNL